MSHEAQPKNHRTKRWIPLALAGCLIAGYGCMEPTAVSYTAARSESDAESGSAATGAQDDPAETPAATDDTPAAPQAVRDISFDTIKFEMEKTETFERSMLTDEIEDLVGKPVRIRGYILPSFQQSGLKQFVLVRDNMECCFGPGAALYDCVLVDMVDGRTADFNIRPVAVEGTFSVSELMGPDGKHLAIYHLDGESVE